MAVIAVEFYVNSIPQLGALILPYMYDDYDQVQKVLESEAGEYASEQLREVAKVQNLDIMLWHSATCIQRNRSIVLMI